MSSLSHSLPPIITHETTVSCDGGGGALGHPRIFLSLEGKTETVCPYCSQRFYRTSESEAPLPHASEGA